jgi:hypothetical protein
VAILGEPQGDGLADTAGGTGHMGNSHDFS